MRTPDGSVALADPGPCTRDWCGDQVERWVLRPGRLSVSPREVIAVAVRWYLRYGLSYRDVEELLAERRIEVAHVTMYR